MTRQWLNDYGMALVLVALCALFTALTWGELRPLGAAAAREVAEALSDEQVVIVAPDGADGSIFADELANLLAARGAEPAAVLTGEPFAVRERLEAQLAEGKTVDVIAAHPAAYHWTFFDSLRESSPGLAQARLVTAGPTRGSAFLRPANLLNVANQIAVIALIAIGMTMIIITGGIDLSAGSLIALSAVTTAWLTREYGGGTEATATAMVLASLGGIGLCGLFGAFNGLMITRFQIPPFIVTLAVMLIARGLAQRISDNQSINQVPASFTWLGMGTLLPGLPNAVVLMLALYVLAHIVMTRTVLGRHIYAVGGNVKAAWLSGVPVNRVLMAVYIAGAMLAGLGGVVMASTFRSGAPSYGQTYEMFVIAAVVVGGTSLSGGEGRMFNTLIGALIIAVVNNGMNLVGVESSMQLVVLGGMILGAVLIDRLRRK